MGGRWVVFYAWEVEYGEGLKYALVVMWEWIRRLSLDLFKIQACTLFSLGMPSDWVVVGALPPGMDGFIRMGSEL